MTNLVITNESAPAVMQAIQQIYDDGDPIRAMLLLTDLADLGSKHGLLAESQRHLLSQIHVVLGEVAILREKNH